MKTVDFKEGKAFILSSMHPLNWLSSTCINASAKRLLNNQLHSGSAHGPHFPLLSSNDHRSDSSIFAALLQGSAYSTYLVKDLLSLQFASSLSLFRLTKTFKLIEQIHLKTNKTS